MPGKKSGVRVEKGQGLNRPGREQGPAKNKEWGYSQQRSQKLVWEMKILKKTPKKTTRPRHGALRGGRPRATNSEKEHSHNQVIAQCTTVEGRKKKIVSK